MKSIPPDLKGLHHVFFYSVAEPQSCQLGVPGCILVGDCCVATACLLRGIGRRASGGKSCFLLQPLLFLSLSEQYGCSPWSVQSQRCPGLFSMEALGVGYFFRCSGFLTHPAILHLFRLSAGGIGRGLLLLNQLLTRTLAWPRLGRCPPHPPRNPPLIFWFSSQ